MRALLAGLSVVAGFAIVGCSSTNAAPKFDRSQLKPPSARETEIKRSLVSAGVDESTADACARLQKVLEGTPYASDLYEQSVWYDRVYCDFEQTTTGFEACYGDNRSRILELSPSEHCRAEAEAMMYCLGTLSDDVSKCDEYKPAEPCSPEDLPEFIQMGDGLECTFEPGGYDFVGDQLKSAVVVECQNSSSQIGFGLRCGAPNEKCTSVCVCSLDGLVVRSFEAENVHDDHFVEGALAKCSSLGLSASSGNGN